MNRDDELRLFASLAMAHPRFKDWVQEQLQKEHANLTEAVDIHLVFRQQGKVKHLQHLLTLLDQAPKALHNR